MDPLPSQHIDRIGVEQPNVSFQDTTHDNPSGSVSSSWQFNPWSPITPRPSVFAAGGNGTPIVQPAYLLHDYTELGAELGGGTTPLQCHLAPDHAQGEGTGSLPTRDASPINNGVLLDMVVLPMTEVGSKIPPPKPGRGIFCDKCPELPSFTGKTALRKHRREVHAPTGPQCPICFSRVSKQPLARHLKKIHGVTDPVAEASHLTVSIPTYMNDTAESLHRSEDAGDAIVPHTSGTAPGRVYCQEDDCGRGFSSKVYLEPHMRFFHSKRPGQTVEVQGEASSPSKDVVERPTVHPLESTFTPTQVMGERMIRESCSSRTCIGTHAPNLGSGSQGIDSVAENSGKQSEISIEPSPLTSGGIDTQPKTASPTSDILSLRCRMCEEPPRAVTKPTVTTCGHLFCSECITRHVVSTSRCPVCDSPLLLYCLFKLDTLGIRSV